METAADFKEHWVDLLGTLQSESSKRFERELEDFRTAVSACYEQALRRLRDTQWVPVDAVSRLIDELAEAAALERARASGLAADLEVARREVDAVREQTQAAVTASHEAAIRDREEAVAIFTHELDAARERARSTAVDEAKVREELEAVRARSQEIVDAQMLQLIEFKRELEQASAEAKRARAEAEAARREATARPAEPTTAAPEGKPRAARNGRAPEFAAIEAVLAESPPVGAWQ